LLAAAADLPTFFFSVGWGPEKKGRLPGGGLEVSISSVKSLVGMVSGDGENHHTPPRVAPLLSIQWPNAFLATMPNVELLEACVDPSTHPSKLEPCVEDQILLADIAVYVINCPLTVNAAVSVYRSFLP
jgi:hypothetical protein